MIKSFIKNKINTITINIVNVIGDVYGVEAESGQKVFELITKAFNDGEKVILSFQDIELVSVSFLNTAVGQLYKYHTEDFIKEKLKVGDDISDSAKITLKRVVDIAKLYYKDPNTFQKKAWYIERIED